MKKILVSGGAGFIASHLTDHFCAQFPAAEIIVVDKMGYASRREYLAAGLRTGQVRLVEASIAERGLMKTLMQNVDLVVHAAAESHVDNSYRDVLPFVESNILGTISLLQAAIDAGAGLFFHVSTDEVYGGHADRDFADDGPLNPTNPYSASKASAEMFVCCYARSYGLKTRMTRANNIYGTRQFPEKLIPKLICDAAMGRMFQVHGAGTVQRSFLHVQDYCRAVSAILANGVDGESYNIPALREYSVIEVVDMVATAMGLAQSDFVEFGPDRPHNDCRYGVVGTKVQALGWAPQRRLEDDLAGIVDWYRANLHLFPHRPAPITPAAPVVTIAREKPRRSVGGPISLRM